MGSAPRLRLSLLMRPDPSFCEKITAVTRRVSGFGENLTTEAGQNSVLLPIKVKSNGPRYKTSPGRQQKT